ncbi:MAG: minor capsid protein [Deltaproteobacteria bacterium]|nr:minor capsid protein [Deltaproteobacteria bacterium]
MATAAQLAARRRLVAAATKRHPPRPMPPAQLPRPTAYTRALTAIAEELNQEIHAALADEGLPAPRADAADGDASIPAFNREGLLARLRRIAEAVVKRRGGFLDTAIQACAANVSSVSRAEWSKQAKAAVGIDLSQVEPNLTPTINAFRRANLDLITSMARDKVERVKAIFDDAPNARVETIRDRIMEEGNVTRRQAALIARDQVLSLNAQVTEKRHAAAGVEKYTWRTSGDGDVRPAHRALNGKVFAYADPPVVSKDGRRENPGQDYQCRCTAEPVIEWGEEEAAKRADADDWKESDHPRDHGKFTGKGGGNHGPLHAKPKAQGGGKPQGKPTTPAKAASPTKPLPPHVTKAYEDAERYAGSLKKPHERKAFNDAVDALYAAPGRSREDVAQLVSGAVYAADRGVSPTQYLRDAHAIVSRTELLKLTIQCIGANAVGKHPWDLAFISKTALKDNELDFLAGDRNTPWPKWKRAADLAAHIKKNPSPPAAPPTLAEAKSREGIMRQANLSTRGALGRVRRRATDRHPRQRTPGQRSADPVGREGARLRNHDSSSASEAVHGG